MIVRRGEIWLATPTRGARRDARSARSCLVLSPPELHDHLRTVIVAPMVTTSSPAPFRPRLRYGHESAIVVLDQIRTLEKSRLLQRTGSLSAATLKSILATLQQLFTS